MFKITGNCPYGSSSCRGSHIKPPGPKPQTRKLKTNATPFVWQIPAEPKPKLKVGAAEFKIEKKEDGRNQQSHKAEELQKKKIKKDFKEFIPTHNYSKPKISLDSELGAPQMQENTYLQQNNNLGTQMLQNSWNASLQAQQSYANVQYQQKLANQQLLAQMAMTPVYGQHANFYAQSNAGFGGSGGSLEANLKAMGYNSDILREILEICQTCDCCGGNPLNCRNCMDFEDVEAGVGLCSCLLELEAENDILELDEEEDFREEFRNCECCHGYVDSCEGEVCQDLGVCQCVVQRDMEEGDFDLIEECRECECCKGRVYECPLKLENCIEGTCGCFR